MKSALSLCPEAIVISGDLNNYSYYSKLVTKLIKSEAPLFEKASVDEFYLDESGMDRYFGCYEWGIGAEKENYQRKRTAHQHGAFAKKDGIESGHGGSKAQQYPANTARH